MASREEMVDVLRAVVARGDKATAAQLVQKIDQLDQQNWATMRQQESGGQQFDAQGQPLTSPAGAVGVAQVMPATGPEAAQLAGVPWDEQRFRTDPAYNESLGKAYYQAQLQRFGRPDLAASAYNAGPERTRQHVEEGRPLPPETQRYIQPFQQEPPTATPSPEPTPTAPPRGVVRPPVEDAAPPAQPFKESYLGSLRHLGIGIQQRRAELRKALSGLTQKPQDRAIRAEAEAELKSLREEETRLREAEKSAPLSFGGQIAAGAPIAAPGWISGGALSGAVQPTVEGESAAANIATSAALGGLFKGGLALLGRGGKALKSKLAPELETLRKGATELGFKLGIGPVPEKAVGHSLIREAAQHNEGLFNSYVLRTIGAPAGANAVSKPILRNAQQLVDEGYEAMRAAPPIEVPIQLIRGLVQQVPTISSKLRVDPSQVGLRSLKLTGDQWVELTKLVRYTGYGRSADAGLRRYLLGVSKELEDAAEKTLTKPIQQAVPGLTREVAGRQQPILEEVANPNATLLGQFKEARRQAMLLRAVRLSLDKTKGGKTISPSAYYKQLLKMHGGRAENIPDSPEALATMAALAFKEQFKARGAKSAFSGSLGQVTGEIAKRSVIPGIAGVSGYAYGHDPWLAGAISVGSLLGQSGLAARSATKTAQRYLTENAAKQSKVAETLRRAGIRLPAEFKPPLAIGAYQALNEE